MHPDYLDYEVREKIHPKAKWHDIKFLARKYSGLALDQIYVQRCNDGDWNGWLVDFNGSVDFGIFQQKLIGVVMLGDRTLFIGVTE